MSGTRVLNACVTGRRYLSNKYAADDVLLGDSMKDSIEGNNCIADRPSEKI